ncbi:MAG: hypothetical protein ACREBO_10540 [Novosphingobium sp.]
MIPVIVVAAIAGVFGCTVDEGSVHPCVVFGNDIGYMLYAMSMMGFLGMATFPTGILALIGFSGIVWLRNRASGRDQGR